MYFGLKDKNMETFTKIHTCYFSQEGRISTLVQVIQRRKHHLQTKIVNPIKEGHSWLMNKIGKWVTCSTGEGLAQQVTQVYLKAIGAPFLSLDDLILWLCYVSILSECCASEHWVMVPKPLLPSLLSPFLSIAGLWSANFSH